MRERSRGVVKWFNPHAGFGFITCNQYPKDILVHYLDIKMLGFKKLQKGQAVTFKVLSTIKGHKAQSVVVIN